MSRDDENASSPTEDERPSIPKERDSITDVHGTVAHFEMAYEPPRGERRSFGPPLRERLPSLLYLGFALALSGVTYAAYASAPGSRLFEWIVVGDRHRPMTASGLCFLVLLGAVGTVIRAQLRGVVVHPDGLEARYLLPLGVPRVRRWMWAQIHRIIVSPDAIAVELWDGTYEKLPSVARLPELTRLVVSQATLRKVDVTRLE